MEPARHTALVTGSARRVGRALAEALVADGWAVLVHARDAQRAAQAAREMCATGGLGADLRDLDACARLVDEATDLLGGRLDLLVNSAASFVHRPLLHSDAHDWAEAFDVNARAPFFLTQRAAPVLARTHGCVVNVSDHAAHEHWTGYAAHSASKAALESLTLSCAKALAPDVRVNAIAPGTILPPDDATPQLLERLRERGRVGNPQQLVDALFALVRDPARTGEIVVL